MSYRPYPGALAALADSSEVGELTLHAAERGAGYGRAIAPVLTGAYRDSLSASSTRVRVGGRLVAAARIEADVPYAGQVEERYDVLGQVADHIESGGAA